MASTSSVYVRTFQKAVEILGGRKNLARALRVPLADLEKWLAGLKEPPIAIFLRAVDLVLDDTSRSAGTSEPADPPPSRDCACPGDSSTLL
jgi:hypothetical protein